MPLGANGRSFWVPIWPVTGGDFQDSLLAVGQHVLSLRAAFRSTFWAVTRGDLLFRVVAYELHACALFRARFDQLLGVIYEAREREQATRRRPKFPTHASP